ncbi:histidine phosphatase family protein [Jatrophihabitans endophyticus]|uniref:histidine phosphatase family protein n=1 Tax=Jatrophihabitans endophyticus TaxID=1206085 RepID=UPI000935385F
MADDAEVWLVRHGETEWSKSGQHTGTTDIPLTEDGERQAAALRALLADVDPVLVLASPRSRAVETARLAGLTVDETVEDLGEWNYGDYEGRTTPDIRREVPGWTIWSHGCPGGEAPAQVQARADRVLRRVAERVGDGPVVLVGHGHFSRALGARWIGLPVTGGANLLLSTATTSVLGAQYGTPTLRYWNLPNPTTQS